MDNQCMCWRGIFNANFFIQQHIFAYIFCGFLSHEFLSLGNSPGNSGWPIKGGGEAVLNVVA
jgi:hypothetical protein